MAPARDTAASLHTNSIFGPLVIAWTQSLKVCRLCAGSAGDVTACSGGDLSIFELCVALSAAPC